MPGINQREDLADAAVRCCLGRYPAPRLTLLFVFAIDSTNVARKRDSLPSVIWLQRWSSDFECKVQSTKRKVRDCTRCNCVESG